MGDDTASLFNYMMEDRTEEILFRVDTDVQIPEEDKPEAVALLLGLSELGGKQTAESLVNYVEINKDRLVSIAKMLLEDYRKNVRDQTNSSR